MLKNSVILFRFSLKLKLVDLLMGESQNHYFYDSGIWGRVPASHNQYCSSFETPRYSHKVKKTPWNVKKNGVYKSQNCGNPQHFVNFSKDGRRKIPTSRSRKSGKSWIWDQYLSRTRDGNFGNMDWIFLSTSKDLLKLRDQETKKLWNPETTKPTN